MTVLKIHIFTGQILIDINYATHPNVFACPVCFSCGFVVCGSESTFGSFPARIVEIFRNPVGGRFFFSVFAKPFSLFRSGNKRTQFNFFDAHEPVYLSIYFYSAYQRKVFSCPVFDRTFVKIVVERPCACVGIDTYQRICRST